MLQHNFEFSACTSILVGKKAMADGSTVIGRNEDSKSAWPKHMVIHPRQTFAEDQTFVSKDNGFAMPLERTRFKYSATPEWTDEFGLFEEDGINEYGVCMSATESAYANERVLGFDPLVEKGIGEEAMVTVVLPYVKTAREGVKRLGAIVEKYGTCESNGILFSDKDEVWYLETGSGHHWVAQRIPDDCYAVVANQLAIQEIAFDDPDNFKTKEVSKLSVIDTIFEPEKYPDLYGDVYHKVRINYYPPRKDNKEAWDNIDIFGWMGYPMEIKVNFLCRDSILAAPIALDLVLFSDLAMRAGMCGIQTWLSFFCKSPMHDFEHQPEHDLFTQWRMVKQTLRNMIGEKEPDYLA